MTEHSSEPNIQNAEKEPSLLDKLASLTTIRNIEQFEFSLLKTMAELLEIKEISMYKMRGASSKCTLMVYSSAVSPEKDPETYSFQSHEDYTSEINLPPDIETALKRIKTTGEPYISDKQGQRYSIIYPVFEDNQVNSLLSFELSHALNEKQIQVLANLLGIAHNFRSLLDENQRDKLTGLLNRHTFEESILKIQELSLNAGHCCGQQWNSENRRKALDGLGYCLAIMDIDDFKQINDRFGHIIGDEVLLLISYIMKQNFRTRDLLFRFGGEEFVVICRVENEQNAHTVLDRFRRVTADYRFPRVRTVTVSGGATMIKKNHLFATTIIGRADKALYFAKKNGKNQIHFYEDLIRRGYLVEHDKAGTIDFF